MSWALASSLFLWLSLLQKGQKLGVTLVQKGKGQECILKVAFLFVGTRVLEVDLTNSKPFSRMAHNSSVFCHGISVMGWLWQRH